MAAHQTARLSLRTLTRHNEITRSIIRSGLRTAAIGSTRSFSTSPATQCSFQQSACASPGSVRTRGLHCTARRSASQGTELVTGPLSRTELYELHIQNGAKMVPFGGYEMPVQYSDLSVGESHKWTREKASIFDVSHMVQYHVEGPGSTAFLESITPSALDTLAPHSSTLSALLHPDTGGIVDDTIITRLDKDKFYIVTNAGCRDKDFAYLSSAIAAWTSSNQPTVKLTQLENNGLIALQGPLAPSILQSVIVESDTVNLKELFFGSSKFIRIALPSGPSAPLLASRGGYTGEDGFEISIPPGQAAEITSLLLEKAGKDQIRLAGLGARDSLRLEAGMCLYGHDIDDTTTPVEAGLSWIIGKSRREKGGFNGADTILAQLTPISKGGVGVSRRRVGFVVEGAPAREGAEIVDATSGEKIGVVTSGCPSPTMGKNIAMGYVKNGLHKSGTEVAVVVRGKKRKATVTKMPFVASKYWKGGQSPG